MPVKEEKKQFNRILDILFILGSISILFVFTTVYLMPFRLDDVLHMDWAREHSFWDAFNIERGEIVRSVRPVFAMTIWLLTHTAGINHYFPWHFVLVGSFLIGLAYAGKTARYIAKENSALYFTTGLFWLAFLPILNVLFWYGDLTFTLELLFIAPSWYYGVRGLLEGRIKLWTIGIACGIFAVLAKEPALLLVHSVLVGTFIFCYGDVKKAWVSNTHPQKIIALLLYLVFLLISLKLYFASPTRSNRFFNINTISHDQLMFFINDRLRYYADSLLNPIARVLLVSPLLYSILRQFVLKNVSLPGLLIVFVLSTIIAVLLIHTLFAFAAILLIAPILNITRKRENRVNKLLLLFSMSVIIILAVLMITVMLVKTQLTELSFVLLVIAGVYWSFLVKEISTFVKPYWAKKNIRYSIISFVILAIIGGLFEGLPVMKAKEQLLRNVRDVRYNANDGIKWMGANLPLNSTVLLAGSNLYGIGEADEMTSKDDEYKLYAQYTFLLGYVRSYFRALRREDIAIAYLVDSTKLSRVLDSSRSQNNYYLFLQTGLDADRFHGLINEKKPLSDNDSLLVKFNKGTFPSEIWKLGR